MPHACVRPTRMVSKLTPANTGAGLVWHNEPLHIPLEAPTWPSSSSPQQYAAPELPSAQTPAGPTASCVNVAEPAARTTVSCGVVVQAPLPNSAKLSSPQHSGMPPFSPHPVHAYRPTVCQPVWAASAPSDAPPSTCGVASKDASFEISTTS